MPVDSFKYLPRSFRGGYENLGWQAEAPVWAPLTKPVEEMTIALLTSAGLYLTGSQPPFDVERERREPLWGDPSYRVIPRTVEQSEIGAEHLHLNTRDFLIDFNVVLPIAPFSTLETEGVIGKLADEHYAFMGFQARGGEEWRTRYAPEVAHRLQDAEVEALVLAPA